LAVRNIIMYFSVGVNVLSLLGLVVGVMMHSGRGGGLSDMFGGAGTTALGSTAAERNLTRITTVMGIIWIGTVVALSFLLVR
jgi:preprotein translocase subunit SecG